MKINTQLCHFVTYLWDNPRTFETANETKFPTKHVATQPCEMETFLGRTHFAEMTIKS